MPKAHKMPGYVPAYQKYKVKQAANRTRPAKPRPVTSAGFEVRDILLREIGFASYAAYLASELWAGIRRAVFARADGLCYRCRKPARHVHHTEYTTDNLLGHRLRGVWAVCPECHRYFHNLCP